MSRLIAGATLGQPFADPLDLHAVGHLGSTGVDDYTVAVARFPGDVVAQLATGVQVTQENVVRVFGTRGRLFIPSPWAPARDGGTSRIWLHSLDAREPRKILIDTPANLHAYLYTIEADHVAEHLRERQSPAMSWADSLGNMRTLDRWRKDIGLVLPVGWTRAVVTVQPIFAGP